MSKLPSMSKHIFFFSLFAVLIGLVIYIASSYINLIAMACIYSLIVYPIYKRIIAKWPTIKPWLAVMIIIISSILLIVIPLVLIIVDLTSQVFVLVDMVQSTFDITFVDKSIENINRILIDNKLGKYQIDLNELESKISEMLGSFAQTVGKTLQVVLSVSFATIFDGLVFLMLTFVIIPNGQSIIDLFKRLIPMDENIQNIYLRRSKLITVDIVKGTFILAFLQGIVAGGFCYILGIPNSLLITFMVMIFAIIPIIGSAFVTVPIAVFYLLTGNYFVGIALLLWQIFVVATVDNIVRPFIVSNETNLHPALMLFAYLGGIKVFGPIGLVYGPLIFVLFLTSLDVFQMNYLDRPLTSRIQKKGNDGKVKYRIPGLDKYIDMVKSKFS